jgi:hypothetical protein
MNDTQLSHLGVLTALNRMLLDTYFSISTVDTAIKLMGSCPDGRAYDILRSMHCVHWKDMPKELREAIPKLIERCINVPAHQFQITQVSPAEMAQVQGGTIRLLTRDA